VRFWDLIPAGFVVFAGGTFTQGLKITGGGGIYMGIVIVPCRLIVIEKLTQKVKTYYPLDTALALMPAVRFGGGAAVGGPRASLGAGAIWGTLETASEFTGLSLGLSGSLTAFEGVSFKMALLRQYNHVRFNTFAALSYELGPSAVLEVQGTAEPIMGLGETLNSLFREGQQQVVIRDSNDHPTPNAEALKKRFGTSNKEPPPELKKIPDGDKENEKPGHNEKK
jgi:hypothetical protein